MLARATASTISTIWWTTNNLPAMNWPYLLKDFADIELIATGRNGLEAIELIEELEPDLVFLDVQMPGLDGMSVIQKLREQDVPLPHFVLATAYDQYALEAFRLEALDYILKPIEKDRLAVTIERARRLIAEKTAKQAPEPLPAPSAPASPTCSAPSCW